jgi:hypothetical protein
VGPTSHGGKNEWYSDRCDCLWQVGHGRACCLRYRGQVRNITVNNRWWIHWTTTINGRFRLRLGGFSGESRSVGSWGFFFYIGNKDMWLMWGSHLDVVDWICITMWMLACGYMTCEICMLHQFSCFFFYRFYLLLLFFL